jgi:hypothetical protein
MVQETAEKCRQIGPAASEAGRRKTSSCPEAVGELTAPAFPASSLFAKQRPYQRAWFKPNGGGNVQELQHIKAPVPALVFRHVRRRLAQPLCHHCLRKPSRFSPSYKQFAQLSVTFGMNGFGQFGSSPW